MILLTAIRAALEAGKEIMTVYTDPEADFEIEKKADNSPLTIADRKSHAVIAKALQQTHYPLLSEEGKQIPFEERRNWNELWIVDHRLRAERNPRSRSHLHPGKTGVVLRRLRIRCLQNRSDYRIAGRNDPRFTDESRTTASLRRAPEELRHRRFPVSSDSGNRSLHQRNEAMPQAGGNRFEGKFPETLPHCRRRSGCLSALCPNHGMGHRRRTCHHPCRRQRSLSGRQTGTATI